MTIYGPEREGRSGRKLCNEEPNYLYSPPNRIRIK